MKPFLSWYPRISLTSALVAITVQGFALKYFMPLLSNMSYGYLLSFLGTSATYIVIYRLLVKGYEVYGWKLLLRKFDISGKWYHELVSKQDPNYRRLGFTVIVQNVFEFHLNAVNYNSDFSNINRTMWKSLATSIDERGNIAITYEADRAAATPEDKLFAKEGIMYALIEHKDGKPYRIVGEFMDAFPSEKRGAVTWMRDAPWKDNLEKISP